MGIYAGINPKLAPLANNGGPTATMSELTGSPAVDAGTSSLLVDADIPTVDQRGVLRVPKAGITPDIGAVRSRRLIAANDRRGEKRAAAS